MNVFLELRRYNCDQVSSCGRGWGRKETGRKRRGTDPSVGMVESANGMCSNKHWHIKITFFLSQNCNKVLINNDFLKHKQACHDDTETSAFNVNIRLLMF